MRVVLLSTTEGEDKPLKYPPMFHSANVAIITKNDMASAAGFNRDLALINLQRVSHHAKIFELSAKTGDGMKAWLDFLAEQNSAVKRK
jgi:hydrogenase nickel incorporation protein HypB